MLYLNFSRALRSASAGIIMIVYPYLALNQLHLGLLTQVLSTLGPPWQRP